MEKYHDIYDRIAKRCLTLSNRAIIQFINGIYGTDYPLDSKITYNWTENVGEDLSRTLADTIITINDKHGYHVEFQMTIDGSIVFRIFEYGFQHAIKSHGTEKILEFPEPVLIYLYEGQSQPDVQKLIVRFGNQGEFIYSIPTIRYLTLSKEELEKKKMIILIPFQLLKLRDVFEKACSPENLESLKSLVSHDIIEAIHVNVKAGNITTVDAQRLGRLTQKLFHHIYDRYPEVAEKGVDDEVDDALILDIDIVEQEITRRVTKEVTEAVTEEVTKEVTKEVTEEVTKEVTKEVTEEVTKEVTKEVTEKITRKFADELAKKDAEILAMKLLIKGKSTEEISRQTGLSLEQVGSMREELQH